jgi:HSP20 family molecular chaperone IbpA
MYPMDRLYGEGGGWPDATRSFDPRGGSTYGYGDPGAFRGYGARGGAGYGAYGSYERRFDEEGYGEPFARGYGDRYAQAAGEHVWRGGVLGWLGSGVRAGAAWVGNQMQSWGALLGGKLKGRTAELGRAMRGRGEQMGSAMEHRGESMARSPQYGGWAGRPPRAYRRPDERILDDVHQRVATAGVDADEVEIEVSNGVVTLSGRVPRRFDKRVVEEVAEQVFGVQEVQNHLRLARGVEEGGARPAGGATGPTGNGGSVYGTGAGTPS